MAPSKPGDLRHCGFTLIELLVVCGILAALSYTAWGAYLGIQEGAEVYTLIKASSVIIMTGAAKMKLSARNQLHGVVPSCKKGSVNGEVGITLAGGKTITAIITNASIDALALKEGDTAIAVIKSSSVILGVGL